MGINSKRISSLYIETVYKEFGIYQIDSNKIAYYQTEVNDSIYDKLISELNVIDLDLLNFDGGYCCDDSMITVIIYYNGKRKYLKSMFPPEKADNLISILYGLCELNDLEKINVKFEIEK